jgi:hypothetical protein
MRFSPANTFILALTCMVINPVLAIDLLPGDIVAPKPGAKQLLLSYLSSERNDLYKNNVVTSVSDLNLNNCRFELHGLSKLTNIQQPSPYNWLVAHYNLLVA